MIAKYSRPNHDQPWRDDTITLRTRSIATGTRVYAVGNDPARAHLTRRSKDFDSIVAAMEFITAQGERLESAGFTRTHIA